MNRKDILRHDYEFIKYEPFWDSRYMNRFILMIPREKESFFKSLNKTGKHDNFILKDNVFYISDGDNSYAFELNNEFEDFVNKIIQKNVPLFYICFAFPGIEDAYDFSFISKPHPKNKT